MSAASAAAASDRTGLRLGAQPPLSLYVHVPWCVRKCPYCDFNSYETRSDPPEHQYVTALLRDLHEERALAADREVISVFIGGGTPSVFSGAAIAALLEGIRAAVRLAPDAEITLEANPGAADASRFAEFRNAGVNRLSIGVQSFRDVQLRNLGRVHDAAAARAAYCSARDAGFDNVNLDLMYGLPGDTVDGAMADLEQALELAPAHLSWYQLTLEPGTAFHRRPPALPPEDTVLDIERRGRARLAARGYERYEISAYARDGRRCTHNLNYWLFGDYLGIGAGAHGKLTLPREGVIVRRAKTRNPRTYTATAGSPAAVTEERVAAARQAALELMMNALRLPEGVDVALFEARAGQPLATIDAPLREAWQHGWLTLERDRLKPTAAGLGMLNRLLALFC